MSSRNGFIETHIYDYILTNSLRDRDELKRLRQETRAMPMGGMQVSPDQGQFMGLLVELIGAKRIVEVGTFTGYSSIAMALALPADGRLIACDVSDEFTSIARRYWQEAGVTDKIELRLGPAVATLDEMLAAGEAGCFDMAFIDADKENYDGLLRALSATFAPGRIDPNRQRAVGRAARRCQRAVRKHRGDPSSQRQNPRRRARDLVPAVDWRRADAGAEAVICRTK